MKLKAGAMTRRLEALKEASRKSYDLMNSGIESDSVPNNTPRKRAKTSRFERIADAKANANNYSVSDRDAFRSIYRERFAESYQNMPASLEAISSLADKRIEESRKSGEFEAVEALHGKQIDLGNENPYTTTTEYFLNRIVHSQNLVPPWIDQLKTIDREVDSFRLRLSGELNKGSLDLNAKSIYLDLLGQINKSIRDFNLIAPSTSRKTLLDFEHEIDKHMVDDVVSAASETPVVDGVTKNASSRSVFRELLQNLIGNQKG